MDQAAQRIKAKLDATITEYRLAGRKFNYNDLLADIALQQISESKHKANGNGSEPERYCWCDELLVNGKRVPCPPYHDCSYVAARSALVYEAERTATERIGGDPTASAAEGHRWTKIFCVEMERLAFNAGLSR